VLLAFYDYPAEHWIHLRTTDESVKGARFGFTHLGGFRCGACGGAVPARGRSPAGMLAKLGTDGSAMLERDNGRGVRGARDRRRWAA
jgi:hypothetical protein